MLSPRRRLAAIVLGFGAFAGFLSGIHWMNHGNGGWRRFRHGPEDFETHVADVCTRAAERVWNGQRIQDEHPSSGRR